ncbi:prohead core protein [Helicobacter pylori]|nr:prohead core protein [Helicobacter pylori]
MSEPLETLDKDKQAMSEAIKKDIEKDKENLARVEADKKVKADESEKGYEKDDDKKADKLDKEIAKDKASPNKDELYEEDDRVKRDKERDDALRDKEKAKDDALRDKEKAKDDACMVRADEDTIEDDEEYGDDDKLRDEILGVMEELCDTLNDSLNFKKVVCMGGKVSIAFEFLIFCSQSLRKIQILRIYFFVRV